MQEIWKDIEGYEGYYQVSNLGRIKSIDRNVKRKGGKLWFKEGTILNNKKIKGYYTVNLCKDGTNKFCTIHRIVAETFLPNPDNLPCVNHKDENKQNNVVWINEDGSIDYEKSNLEWCSYQYNNTYGTVGVRKAKKLKNNNCASKPILQFDINGNFIKEWISAALVEKELNIKKPNICKCCKGERNSAGGYIWKYK